MTKDKERRRSWLREAISDENQEADIAYVAIGALTGGALGALTFICFMAWYAFYKCVPLVKPDVVVNCSFDPLPIGQSVGLIFTAFATLIGALCGYMLATRRQLRRAEQNVIAPNATMVSQTVQGDTDKGDSPK